MGEILARRVNPLSCSTHMPSELIHALVEGDCNGDHSGQYSIYDPICITETKPKSVSIMRALDFTKNMCLVMSKNGECACQDSSIDFTATGKSPELSGCLLLL